MQTRKLCLLIIPFLFLSLLPTLSYSQTYLFTFNKWDAVFRIPDFAFSSASVSSREAKDYFQFNITLDETSSKTVNVWTIPIQTVNLTFYYQPPLNEEVDLKQYDSVNATHAMLKDEVMLYRPLNVVGSYAVYSNHENNQYENGKLLHIYRPLLVDAKGETSWGNLNITKDTLTITANSTWLQNAVFPVVIDPTFGYESIGATTWTIAYSGTEVIIGSIFPGAAGTATQISAVFYTASPAGDRDVSVGIYLHSDLSLVYGDPSNVVSLGTAAAFVDFPISDTAISATDYLLVVWADYEYASKNIYSRYDTGDANQRHSRTLAYNPAAWPNPFGTAVHGTEKLSIHCDYIIEEGLNLSFNLTAVPVITATLNKGIEIFKAVSGAPAFTSSITYGLEWLFSLSEIPKATATLVYGRALAFGLSEIPKFIADLAYEFQLKAGKNLYFNLSIIPQFIVDMTVQKGKELTFNLSIIGAFIADLAKNQEIFRSLSETPKFIVDMTREIELAFVEFVLLEVPIFTATLGFLAETGMTTSDLANGAIALALIALIFALCGIGLAVKKAND